MRLVNQKGAQRKGQNGAGSSQTNGRQHNGSLINGMAPHPGPQGAAKNAW